MPSSGTAMINCSKVIRNQIRFRLSNAVDGGNRIANENLIDMYIEWCASTLSNGLKIGNVNRIERHLDLSTVSLVV